MSEQPYDGYDDTGGFAGLPGAAAVGMLYQPVHHFAQVHTGAFAGGVATHEFAGFQQETAGIAAQAAVSRQSIGALRQEVRGLASDFPVGIAGATQYVGVVQSLGVTAEGSEAKVGSLARVFIRLNAATGTGPAVALGFGQLNRQVASLDPQRVERFADSLVTLEAKGGGSAEGIVTMSRAITPFAQQAGIGEAATLGIASAFTKLGDEGTSAASAVSKVLSDISQSVQTGSQDIGAYASAVGMTVKQFRDLYQVNPVGALEKVVGALGQGGGQAAYLLQSRGLGGVRTQRALLQLAQSGSLQEQVQTSLGGYGSGATATGAHAAFNTLDSSLTKVRTTSGEAAAALGGPFAHVLSFIAKTANTVLAPVSHLLNSGPGQAGLTGALGVGGLGYLGFRATVGGLSRLSGLALGRAAVTSGPVSAAVAGVRGNAMFAEGSMLGRAYNPMMAAAAAGSPLGVGVMERPNQLMYNVGYGLNQGLGLGAFGATARRSLAAVAARRGVTVASGAAAGYLNLLRAPFHLAYEDPTQRQFALTAPGGATRAFGTEFSDALKARDLAAASKATRDFVDGVGGAGKAAARVGGAFLLAGKDVTEFSARTAFGAGRAVLGSPLARGIGSALSGPTGIAALAYGGYQLYKSNQQANAQFNIGGQDVYGELSQLRDGLGLAGDAAMSFADQAKQAAAALAPKTATNFATARTLTDAQIAAAQGHVDSSKSHTTFRGTAAQIAAQVSQVSAKGLTPADLSGIGAELYKQGFSQSEVNQILGQVKTGPQGPLTRASVAAGMAPAAQSASSYSPSLLEGVREGAGAIAYSVSNTALTGGSGALRNPLPKNSGGNAGATGTHGVPIEMSKTAKAIIDRQIKYMGQQYGIDLQAGGLAYAEQRKLRAANIIQSVADGTGQADVMAYAAKQLSDALSGKSISISAAQIDAAGGNIVQATADAGHSIDNQKLSQWQHGVAGQHQGITLTGAGGARAIAQPPADAATVAATRGGGYLAYLGSHGGSGPVATSLSALYANPQDTEQLTKTQRTVVDAMRAAGKSWTQIANESGRVAANAGQADTTTYNFYTAVAQYADTMRNAANSMKTPGQQVSDQFSRLSSMLHETGPGSSTDVTAAQQQLPQLRQQVYQEYQQRLAAQFQYQVASTRATEDYQRSTHRAEEDFQRQSLYSEQDFQRSRFRSIRDFNIQVGRERQDAAKTLYDPYQRIQVQPVWDAMNLLGNEQEQIQAMRTQLANINKLRDLGLSEQAIRQLSLYDPGKSQQVQELVDDLAGHHNLVGQYNQVASRRQQVAGQLLGQDPTFRRQTQDFRRQLSDSHADYTRQVARMGQEFATSMDRAASDQQRALNRMAADLHNADLQITGDFATLQSNLIRVMNGQQVDWSHLMVDGITSTITAVKNLAPQWNEAFNLLAPKSQVSGPQSANAAEFGGGSGAPSSSGPQSAGAAEFGGVSSPTHREVKTNSPTANRITAKSMAAAKFGWTGQQWQDLATLWTNESGFSEIASNASSGAYGIPQGVPSVHPDYAGVMHKGAAWQIAWGLQYIKDGYGTPANALAFWDRTDARSRPGAGPDATKYPGHWYGAGGIATVPQLAGVAEAGSPEAMIPLNDRGAKFFAAALRSYGGEEMRMLTTGGRATSVVIHAAYHYDQRTDFTGSQITVEASDPNEMARKLQAKTARDNLTAARGVAWSRTPTS